MGLTAFPFFVATGEDAGKASLWVSEGGLFPSLLGRFVKIRKYPWVFIR